MILIEPKTFKKFEDYYLSISESAKKNYKYAMKKNAHLSYQLVDFDENEVMQYMALWEKQLVRGKEIKWGFGIQKLSKLHSKKRLLVFKSDIAMQFLELKDGYWECHPPMYDKKFSEDYLAKFMWFRLIDWAIIHQLAPLNLGGGIDDWVECISRRAEFPNTTYKWMYVPVEVKKNPSSQPTYYLSRKTKKLYLKPVTKSLIVRILFRLRCLLN